MSTVTSSQYNYLDGTYFPTPLHLQQQPSQPYSAPPVVPPVYSAPAAVPDVYFLPQYLQTQQLFERVAQTITPEAIENVKAALASSELEQKAGVKKKAVPRKAAGQTWEDPTLAEWPENDFRLFCGNLGNEVNDDVLSKAFSRFPSFNMARVVREKRTGKYVGNRPVQLRKSKWKDRIDYEALARQKNASPKKAKSPKKSVLHK